MAQRECKKNTNSKLFQTTSSVRFAIKLRDKTFLRSLQFNIEMQKEQKNIEMHTLSLFKPEVKIATCAQLSLQVNSLHILS